MPDTLRQYLRDALLELEHGFPGAASADIESALEILDEAEADMFDHPVGKVRLVPDYQHGRDPEHCAPGWTEPGA